MNSIIFRSLCRLSDYYFQGKQRLSILIYHRVLANKDFLRPDEPTTADFEWQMESVANYFNPFSLSDAIDCLVGGRLPPRAVCITFDDGYADNATCALPILKKLDIPATVFVASGYLNGGRMWNDTVIEAIRLFEEEHLDLSEFNLGRYSLDTEAKKLAATIDLLPKIKYLNFEAREDVLSFLESSAPRLPDNLMLTNEQLVQLADAGIEIGGHTRNHPILSTLSIEQSIKELELNKSDLELITSRRLNYFAYPNGKPGVDYLPEHRDLVESMGFKAAVSTSSGVANGQTDNYQLPRFTPWDKSKGRFISRLLFNQRNVL